jgi:hypothetical protein
MDGMFRITSKNFSKNPSKAASVNAGFGSKPEPKSEINMTFVRILLGTDIDPFDTTLFFFRRAAEKPEAHTYTQYNVINKYYH